MSRSSGTVWRLLTALALAAIAPRAVRAQATPAPPPATAPVRAPVPAAPADVSSPDAIIAALYDVISGPPGRRNWDRFRSLFVPGARLIPTGPPPTGGASAARVLDPDGFMARSAPSLESNGFFEREIARRMERFGNVAHAFSTYESRHAANDPTPFARGINSIQLFNDGSRWWVVTVFWDAERPGNPIPEQYLRSGTP